MKLCAFVGGCLQHMAAVALASSEQPASVAVAVALGGSPAPNGGLECGGAAGGKK